MLYCYLSRRVCSIIKFFFFFFKVLFSFLLLWVFFLAIFYALKLCRFSSPPPHHHRLIIIIMSLAFDEYGRPFLIVKVPTLAVPEYAHDHRLRVFAPAPFSRRFFFAL